ncbi:MAG: glycosyltransferase family 4 protein [Acidimicrobiales bacterium]
MRVALDVSAVPARVAGAGRYVVEIARRLAPAGVTATLVTRRDDAARWEAWCPGARVAAEVPAARAARLLYEAWSLGESDAARAADVWHGPHYTMPRRGSTPAVVTIHDLTYFTHPEWHERAKVAFFTRAIEYAARHARVLVCVSETTRHELDRLVPAHAPVVVAPHGVDLARFEPDRAGDRERLAGAGLPTDAPYLFFVGTFEPRKGLDVLVEAFAALALAHPEVELWLAGQAGWGTASLDRALAGHPAGGPVRRLGFVDDDLLPTLLRGARAVVYPSRGEGFGLPVLEALACATPVVTSADTVMAEVAGGTATLARAGDARDLARALDEVLREAGDAEAARRRRARAEQFTWESSIARHLEAYQRAVGR